MLVCRLFILSSTFLDVLWLRDNMCTETLCGRYALKEWVQPSRTRPTSLSKWRMNWRAKMHRFWRKTGSLPASTYTTQKAVFGTLKSDIPRVKHRKIRYYNWPTCETSPSVKTINIQWKFSPFLGYFCVWCSFNQQPKLGKSHFNIMYQLCINYVSTITQFICVCC